MRWFRRAAIAAMAAALSAWAASYAIDFSVYWTIAKSAALGTGSFYGGASRLPWPMWYRYPPLFAYLIAPLALLPFRTAAFVWALGKLAVAAAALKLVTSRFCPLTACRPWAIAALIAIPYALFELRYGNAQFYVFALTAYALWRSSDRPVKAAAALGLAIAFKLWPLFFAPYLAALGRWRTAAASVAFALLFTLSPALIVGWPEHARDLEDWYVQEYRIASEAGTIWFPSQSLYGVMSRHLTDIDYAAMPDPNYPEINWAELDPATLRLVWMAIAVLGYCALLVAARRSRSAAEAALHGMAFCALILLEPYAQRQSALVVLVFPAIVAAANWAVLPRNARALLLTAATLSVVQFVTPSSYWQRVFQVWGFDALLALLLLAALAARTASEPLPKPDDLSPASPQSKLR